MTRSEVNGRQKVSPVCKFYKKHRHKTSHCAANERFLLRIRNNPCRNFSNLTKHSHGVIRLYECSRNAGLLLVSQRSSAKTPRWQPRGRDTHSFRPLVQEEKVSFGEGYSSLCPRVNLCLASSRKSAADSILDGKGDTHEIQFISTKRRIARGSRDGRTGFRKADQQDHQHQPVRHSGNGEAGSGRVSPDD